MGRTEIDLFDIAHVKFQYYILVWIMMELSLIVILINKWTSRCTEISKLYLILKAVTICWQYPFQLIIIVTDALLEKDQADWEHFQPKQIAFLFQGI